MAKALVFPSDIHVQAACDGASKDEAVARLTKQFMPSSNATKDNKKEWLDGVAARVDSCLAKAAKAAEKPKQEQKDGKEKKVGGGESGAAGT